MVARAELTLPKPSRLTMIARSTAGAADGGEQGEGMGPFPLPFFVGAMATEGGRKGSRLASKQKLKFERRKDRGRTSNGKGSGCVHLQVRLA